VAAPPEADRVVALAAGGHNTFAIYASGKVQAWGGNSYESLALGKTKPVTTPTFVPSLTDVKQVSAASMHSCAVLRDDSPRCWGRNFGGALGDGTHPDHTTGSPAPVAQLSRVREIQVAGNHGCAIDSNGVAHCWGMIISGGTGSPAPVPELPPVAGLALGGDSSCAWTQDGAAYCWELAIGLPFNYGEAVNGGDGNIKQTTLVKGLSGATRIATSGSHACAVTSSGTVMCWGNGKRGALGDGKSGGESYYIGSTVVDGYTAFKPVPVSKLRGARSVVTGAEFSCALDDEGHVHCWGANDNGELGTGDRKQRTQPNQVPGLEHVTALAAGAYHVCALTEAADVYCWGRGIEGQLGDGQHGVRAGRLTPYCVLGPHAALVPASSSVSAGSSAAPSSSSSAAPAR
jgi:alpha-tubulin suppressor-like RCC1 family protein